MNDSSFSYVDSSDPAPLRIAVRLVEKLTGARFLESLYLENRREARPGENWFAASVRRLRLDVRYDEAALAAVPRNGPLVIVANHPFGVLDGIVLSWLMTMAREDVLVLTNAVLLRAPEIRDRLLPVDFSETPSAVKTNLDSRARARAHLAGGGALVVFPAGAVSTSPDRLGRTPAVDARWQPIVGQLVQKSKAGVLPVYFPGQNSRLFQIASHIHPTLRLALFFHELRRRIATAVPVVIGPPIGFADLPAGESRQALADRLMRATYELAAQPLPR